LLGVIAVLNAQSKTRINSGPSSGNDTSKIDLLLLLSEETLNSQPAEAFGYASEAARLSALMEDRNRIALSNEVIARFYLITSVYDKALEYFLMALEDFNDIADTLRMARCYDEIGTVNMLSGDFQNARLNFNRALNLNKAIASYPQITGNYMNLGSNYLKMDSIDKGLSYFLVSLMIADSLKMEEEKVTLMRNIGFAYAKMGLHEEALGHFYKVLELLIGKPDDLTRCDAQINIAKGYFALQNYPAALQYARQGFDLAKLKRFDQMTRDAAQLLSDIYATRGEYRQAYYYVKIYRNISDTIMNSDKAEQLARIQTLYEVNSKEEENLSLKKQIIQYLRQVRSQTLLIIMITCLVLVLATLLFMLNRMNNRQIALNNKLALQRRELENLNELKDKFFSFVAHNLKNPFNTIMGFSELMQRATDSKDMVKVREYSGLIHDLSLQVQKVLSNLLEWSRLQRRTFEVKPETVELTGLIRDVVEMNNKEAARKDIHLNIYNDGNVFVVADRTMITAVLQNLFTNAIHFTPPSGSISINCSADEQHTEVTVTDTGIGISEEDAAMLFNFDFSKDRMGGADHGGAGLGLVICHEMLAKNGGTIRVHSEQGKGSSFTFTLPVAIRHEMPNEPEQHLHSDSKPEDVTDILLKSEIPVNQALLSELRDKILPQFEEITKVLSIEELGHFSRMLIYTGEKYHHAPLAGYGRSLQSLTLGHQIDQIIRILPKFREYLKKIHVL
jgi:signal transduction histidine kinase